MPRRPPASHPAGAAGQASVEFLGLLPALLIAILIAAQLCLAGHALWSAGIAARAGARANHVGADAEAVARAALPAYLRRGVEVRRGSPIRVAVRVPGLIPGLPALVVSGRSSLEPDGG